MAMVLVLREEQFVIVDMDILGMDVKFHQFQQLTKQVQSHHHKVITKSIKMISFIPSPQSLV